MTDLFANEPIGLDEMIAEAERELHMRRSVYPRRVANAKMTQDKADRAMAVQQAIIDVLKRVDATNNAH